MLRPQEVDDDRIVDAKVDSQRFKAVQAYEDAVLAALEVGGVSMHG